MTPICPHCNKPGTVQRAPKVWHGSRGLRWENPHQPPNKDDLVIHPIMRRALDNWPAEVPLGTLRSTSGIPEGRSEGRNTDAKRQALREAGWAPQAAGWWALRGKG